jgi:hypothetical protein
VARERNDTSESGQLLVAKLAAWAAGGDPARDDSARDDSARDDSARDDSARDDKE